MITSLNICFTFSYLSSHLCNAFIERSSLSWPRRWNLQQDQRHGTEAFAQNSERTDALKHINDDDTNDGSSSEDITHSTALGTNTQDLFTHTITISKPKICGLDIEEDPRCDTAKAVLFGESTSVGQICSIAEAVRPFDPDSGTYRSIPENMPGTCCLDNVKTLETFGERVSFASISVSRLCPFPLLS